MQICADLVEEEEVDKNGASNHHQFLASSVCGKMGLIPRVLLLAALVQAAFADEAGPSLCEDLKDWLDDK